MTTGDTYRDEAADLHTQAQFETNQRLRTELEYLALAYLRLADQADRNAKTDIVYEAVPVQPVVQQQQQIQPKKQP